MGMIPQQWKRLGVRILTGVAVPLFLPAGMCLAGEDNWPVPIDSVIASAPAAPASPLTVQDCLRIAGEKQPALAAYRASLAAANEAKRGVDHLLVPTFIQRDLPIRRQQACLGVQLASAGLTQAEWDTSYAVVRTYYGVIYAREQLGVAKNVAESLKFYRDRVKEMVAKGESREHTQSTVDKISLYLSLAETRQAEAQRGIDRATSALREATGLSPETPVILPDIKMPTPTAQVNKDSVIAMALERRGEIAQVNAAAEAVELEVCAQSKTHMPTAKTFAAASDVHARPVPQGHANGDYRPGAISLEMPTHLVGPKFSRVERARNFSARAQAVVEKTRNLIALEADDAFLKWQEALTKLPMVKAAADAGARLSKNTRDDFGSGQKVKIDDILTNEVLAGQAIASYNETVYTQIIALAGLQRVTAGGFDAGFGGMFSH